MFQLYDRTRRRVCIASFLVFGVLPALAIGGWCLYRCAPGCVQAEAEELSLRLGLDVKLGGMQYLRPGVALYEQVEAADVETGKTVFRCRLLEIARRQQADQQGQLRPTLAVSAAQGEVESASLPRIWRCLQRTLEGLGDRSQCDVQFSAAELTLRAADGSQNSQTLTEVSGAVQNLLGGAHADIIFRLAGTQTPEPARIRVVRNRQVSPPASGFELYTGDGELPCDVLAVGLSELKPLGPRCRFHGRIWANETPDGWEGDVTGRLSAVDLGGLVSNWFPYKLAGIGEVSVKWARFRGGRLDEGSAIVSVGPGTIDRALVDAAVSRLGLAAAADLPAGPSVPFERLAFAAALDAQGLHLEGRCTTDNKGTMLSYRGRRLVGQPRQPAPAAALAQVLSPQSAVQVPASRQTDWLLRHLPAPEAAPPEAEAPRAIVRLHDAQQR